MLGSNSDGKVNIQIPDIDTSFYLSEKSEVDLTGKGGVYRFYHDEKLIYCGVSNDLHRRMNEHLNLKHIMTLSEFDRYKKCYMKEILCTVFFEDDFTAREIYESWIIRTENPIFNILKKERKSKYELSEEMVLMYDKLYRDKDVLSINNIDKTKPFCEKNAVILSKMYMLSQYEMDSFINSTVYVKNVEFRRMWKFYKDVAIKHNLNPIVENGNLIYNVAFAKFLKIIDGRYVFGGQG